MAFKGDSERLGEGGGGPTPKDVKGKTNYLSGMGRRNTLPGGGNMCCNGQSGGGRIHAQVEGTY